MNCTHINIFCACCCGPQAADEDGSGELDVDEFCAKLGPHLGVNLKPQQVAQLFMKIDADAGGTVDWCADMCMQQQQQRALLTNALCSKLQLLQQHGRMVHVV